MSEEGPIEGGGDADGNARRGPRRRGRRGRGPAVPFRPGAPAGPVVPRPLDDDSAQQLNEIAAYERRQMRQQNRGWRPPTSGGGFGQRPAQPAARSGGFVPRPAGSGFRPAGSGFRPGGSGFRSPGGGFPPRPGAGGFRPGAAAGPRSAPGRPLAGGRGRPVPGYQDQVRRVTGGAAVAPQDAGEPIAGPHAVLEAIRSGRAVRKLYVSQERGARTGAVNDLIAEAQQRRIFVNFVEKLDLARMSPIEEHQGVVAIVEGRKGVDLDELMLHLETVAEAPLVLIVDSLQDPQNFGVLLRSAEGAGVDGVVIPRHRAVGITASVAKTSSGASEHLLVADVANLRQAIDALKEKGIWVIGADETGEMLYDEVDYRGATAIVIGGEGEGIRRLVLEGCDEVVRIPMEGKISSLNAAAAGTVLLYEALRQRRRDAAPPGTRTPRPEQTAATMPELGRDDRDEGDAREELEHETDDVADAGSGTPDAGSGTADAGDGEPTAEVGSENSADHGVIADAADLQSAGGDPAAGPGAVSSVEAEAAPKPKRKTAGAAPRKRTTKAKKIAEE